MGTGAIVLLVTLATIAAIRSNNRMVVGDTVGAVVTGVLFALNVALMLLGNPWVWAGWMCVTVAKTLFYPSDETLEVRNSMLDGAFAVSLVVSVIINGLIFMLFQWLR